MAGRHALEIGKRVLRDLSSLTPTSDVDKCFRRVKYGQQEPDLQKRRNDLDIHIRAMKAELKETAIRVLINENQDEFDDLKSFQYDVFVTLYGELTQIDREIKALPERMGNAEAELEEILCYESVIGVRAVSKEIIAFRIRATTVVNKVLYHLGDWEIFFGVFSGSAVAAFNLPKKQGDAEHYRCKRVTETRLDRNVYDCYPVYDRGDGSFCFGASRQRINDLAMNGQIAHALNVAVRQLHSFNSSADKESVPLYFKTYSMGADK